MYAMSNGRTPWMVLGGYDDFGGNKLVGFVPGNDKIQNLFATDKYHECAKIAQEMYDKGYIYRDCAVDDNSADLFTQGKIFARLEQSKPGKLEEMNAKGDFEYGEIKITDIISNATDAQGSMMAIPISCENPVRVMKFIELLNTDKYLNNLINFGIEDKHYKKIGENRITLIKNSGYSNVGMQWVFGNIFENYLYDGESDTKYEDLKKFNDEATFSTYMGFVPNLEAVKIQVSSCSNVIAEYGKVIEYGVVNVDEVLPTFLDKLKQAGIDEIVEEVQKQYDDWKNTNDSTEEKSEE